MTAIVSVLKAAVLRCVSIFLLPAMWRLAPAKAWLSALTRPTNLRITNPQTRDCIFVGKHDDVLARVTSS
jgi:hypothetical protein